jgi:type II secretory pathway pseudopilin PulG
MSELDLVRELFPERAVDSAARARVRAAVAERMFERRRRVPMRRPLVPALAIVAAAAAATLVLVLTGTSATVDASAARVLHQAAATARQGRSLAALGPGQYLYTKSTDEYLNTAVTGGRSFAFMVPYVREIWLRRNGTGWLHQVGGTPRFLTEHDRQAWIDAGRPELDSGSMDTILQNSDGPTPPMASLDLPTDPDALFAKLQHDAAGYGDRMHAEMFVMIGDDLRENYTTPAQRAALFEAAARIPGITLVEGTRDGAGRLADAVAIDDSANRERQALLFDPQTRALLGEEDSMLDGNSLGYPAGTVIGRATYLGQAVVDSVPASVLKAAKH